MNKTARFLTAGFSERCPMRFKSHIRVFSSSCVGGKKERSGPLGKTLDEGFEDEKLGKKTWEKAESEMCRIALIKALEKGGITEKSVDYLLAGDLMNQCTGAAYGLSGFDIPYLGLYGACSTFAEGITLGANLIEAGTADCVAVLVSSHFCTAERQYRYPLEYGSFSENTAQNTVTGAGCMILCRDDKRKDGVYLTDASPGIICDRGIKDAANMGAAMCTAAVDTLLRYFHKTETSFGDYGLTATGDLGKEGKSMACDILKAKGIRDCDKLCDCGEMIYDTESQDVGCGGSGCGCSAVVTCGHILSELKSGAIENAIVVGTGAMMSPQTLLQGESIPAVAHLIKFERY